MKPYYQSGCVTIYHGDCLEIFPRLGRFDLLLTDPPYGIGESWKRNKERAHKVSGRDYGKFFWDGCPIAQYLIDMLVSRCGRSVIFGGNYYTLPATRCWLVWDKLNGESDFADCELAWTNLDQAVRKIEHLWNGMMRAGNEKRFHPTQKPLRVMQWALDQAGDEVTSVVDPFMGSGTTLVACQLKGIRCVGIEREERYIEVAISRLSQGSLFSFSQNGHELPLAHDR